MNRDHTCGQLRKSDAGKTVKLCGWVAKRRNLGGLIFVDLRDKTGIVQVTFDDKIPAELTNAMDVAASKYTVDKWEKNAEDILNSIIDEQIKSFESIKSSIQKNITSENTEV